MPIQLIPFGSPTTLVQNQVYAIPGKMVRLYSSVLVDYSIQSNGPWISLAGVNAIGANSQTAGVEIAGGFIRCTLATCDVVCGS